MRNLLTKNRFYHHSLLKSGLPANKNTFKMSYRDSRDSRDYRDHRDTRGSGGGGGGGRSEAKIYVGNLPPDVKERELESLFDPYGRIIAMDLKTKRGPPFAFIEFEDARDAQDAVFGRDRYSFYGWKLKVEFTKGAFSSRGGRGGGGGFRGGGRGGGGGGGGPPRRSEYRVTVKDLPQSGSWQDLKDHMREAGDVLFTDVDNNCTGIVEFLRRDDMKYAIKNLDGSKFTSHEGEEAYITVVDASEDNSYVAGSRRRTGGGGGGGGGGRYRSRSRSRERHRASPSYSPMKKSFSRSRSRSSSRSRSPYH